MLNRITDIVNVCYSYSASEQRNVQLELTEDFAELPGAGFAGKPLGSADGAQRKAAAACGIVAELERVVLALRGHNVLALGVADAVRGDGNLDAGVRGENDLFQGERRAGGRVELGGVVGFVDGEAVASSWASSAVRRKSFCTPMEKLVP